MNTAVKTQTKEQSRMVKKKTQNQTQLSLEKAAGCNKGNKRLNPLCLEDKFDLYRRKNKLIEITGILVCS